MSVALLAGCGGSSAGGKRGVMVGENCYRVPPRDLRAIGEAAGAGEPPASRSITLQMPNDDIAARIPGYTRPIATNGVPESTLLVSVSAPSAAEAARMRAGRKVVNYGLWYGLNENAARTFEPIAGTTLYRVTRIPHGDSWSVITRMPDLERRDSHLADDFWIGSCSFIGDRAIRSCFTIIERDGFFFDIHTIEENLPLRAELARYVTEKFASWKQPCD